MFRCDNVLHNVAAFFDLCIMSQISVLIFDVDNIVQHIDQGFLLDKVCALNHVSKIELLAELGQTICNFVSIVNGHL